MGKKRLEKNPARSPNASAGEENVRQGLRGLFQFVPKKLEQGFPVFMGFFERFAESCSNSVFQIGTGFFPCSSASRGVCSNCSSFQQVLYINTYIEPIYIFFFRALGLKIIGTNGTFTGNAHHYGKKYVPTPILRIGTTGTNGQFSKKNPHKWA